MFACTFFCQINCDLMICNCSFSLLHSGTSITRGRLGPQNILGISVVLSFLYTVVIVEQFVFQVLRLVRKLRGAFELIDYPVIEIQLYQKIEHTISLYKCI